MYVSNWGVLFDTKVTLKFRVTFVSKMAPHVETYPYVGSMESPNISSQTQHWNIPLDLRFVP